jgi:hypothetical protein
MMPIAIIPPYDAGNSLCIDNRSSDMDKLELNNQRLDASAPPKAVTDTMNASEISPEQYGAELHSHYKAYVDWAISNWPLKNPVLDISVFSKSRAELDGIRERLMATRSDDSAAAHSGDDDPSTPGAPQFVPVDPMPWP